MSNILTTSQFNAFRAAWKARANAKALSAADMLLHALVCHGDTRGFTPITNAVKLAAGASPSGALSSAAAQLAGALRGGAAAGTFLLGLPDATPEQVQRLQDTLRDIRRGTFKATASEGRARA